MKIKIQVRIKWWKLLIILEVLLLLVYALLKGELGFIKYRYDKKISYSIQGNL